MPKVVITILAMSLGLVVSFNPLCARPVSAGDNAKGTDRRAADLTDEIIQSNTEERLRLDDRISWGSLVVKVQDRKVTLLGEVRTIDEKGLATGIASAVPFVESIANHITVDPALPSHRGQPRGRIDTTTRDSVLEGPDELKDKQILP